MAEDRENLETERRFNPRQEKFLKGCAKRGKAGIERWNRWRRRHVGTEILLERADFSRLDLRGIDLGWGHRKNPRGHMYYGLGHFAPVHLRGAVFDLADVSEAHFELADLRDSHFMDARLEGACFVKSDLRGAYFLHAVVDGSTLFWDCPISRYRKGDSFTDFSGVPIDAVRTDPGTRGLLEYNIRRLNWEQWYVGDRAKKPFGKIETRRERALRVWEGRIRFGLTLLVRGFWVMSDYGHSTGRIIGVFFALASVFALVYWLRPVYVTVCGNVGDIRGFLHAFYFSVVTMTTLGFGDIAANPDSWGGQTLLMFQVILGYVLLGALVTRFAVLFTAGGPAGRFSKSGADGAN